LANILVYIELVDDQASWASLLTLRQGRRLATELGATLYGVLPCAAPPLYGDNDIIAVLSRQGADKVILMTHSALSTPALFRGHGDALLTATSQFPPSLLLFPAGPAASDIAPRIAARLGALFVNRPRLEVASDHQLVIQQPAYNLSHVRRFSTSDLEHAVVAVVSPDPQTFSKPTGSEEAEVVVISPGFKEATPEAEPVTEVSEAGALTERVVLAGSGVRDTETWQSIRQLADRLDADLRQTPRAAASTLAPDVPVLAENHTGALPGMVLALGVTDSAESLRRLPATSYLVAVHEDPSAPVFERAHLALKADPAAAVREMLEAAGPLSQNGSSHAARSEAPPAQQKEPTPVQTEPVPSRSEKLGAATTLKAPAIELPADLDDDPAIRSSEASPRAAPQTGGSGRSLGSADVGPDPGNASEEPQ